MKPYRSKTVRTVLGLIGLISWFGMAPVHAHEGLPPIPEPALRAEMQQNWQQAARIYRELLAIEPQRIDLWRRLADVLAADGQAIAAAEALTKASRLVEDDVDLALDASRAWAQAGKPNDALERCGQAATLKPDDTGILEICATQANWVGDPATAAEYYERIYELERDTGTLRRLARASGEAGQLDRSVRLYHRYFETHPEDAEALLEYATVETWRGNFAAAHDALYRYRELAGEDDAWRARMARLLAWANRPAKARPFNELLLAQDSDNYEYLYTRMLILRADQRPAEAIESLEPLKRLRPESKDTLDAIRSTHAFLRSNAGLDAAYRIDSDDIRIREINLKGRWALSPETALHARLGHQELRVPSASPFVAIDGSRTVHIQQGWLGASHRLGPRLALQGHLGMASIADFKDRPIYGFRAETRPLDNLFVDLSIEQSLWSISPRSASKGIAIRDQRLRFSWQPDLRHFVDGHASYGHLSDGNDRIDLLLAPRRAILRSEHVNLDLGLSAQWLRYDKQLNNGYYDPRNFRRFAATVGAYWKISDDDGLSLQVAPGWHKDENMSNYRFGTDVSLELINGIYRDWFARTRFSYSNRSQATGVSPGYDGYGLHFDIVRRF